MNTQKREQGGCSMRKWIFRLLGLEINTFGELRTTVLPDDQHGLTPNYRIGLIKTMNGGNVLEIGTYKPNQRGSDWVYEFYSVDSNQKLSEAIGIILTMKGLER